MIVGGKKGLDPLPFPVMEILSHGPGDTQAVKGARPSSDLVQNDKASFSGIVQDVGGLLHLDHKCALALGQAIGGANPREDAIHHPEGCLLCRNKRPHLSHEDDERDLAQYG